MSSALSFNKKRIRGFSVFIALVIVHFPLSSSPEIIQFNNIEQQSARYSILPDVDVSWTTMDLISWYTSKSDSYLLEKKAEFIEGYANVILSAAKEAGIPPVLLAGIAWREFGGDPIWIDDLAFFVREVDQVSDSFMQDASITRPATETSFGNVSMQVRRAAQVLGYDPQNLTKSEMDLIISSLKDPVQNFFIAADHLADLAKIDFPERDISDLTIEELKITATRFYRGPELTLTQIQTNTQYGENVAKRFELLNRLLAKHSTSL